MDNQHEKIKVNEIILNETRKIFEKALDARELRIGIEMKYGYVPEIHYEMSGCKVIPIKAEDEE